MKFRSTLDDSLVKKAKAIRDSSLSKARNRKGVLGKVFGNGRKPALS